MDIEGYNRAVWGGSAKGLRIADVVLDLGLLWHSCFPPLANS
jgi:hypothetical protein